MKTKVWFITGASKGLGLSLVKKLISKGYAVAATSRNIDELEKATGKKSEKFLPLTMDLVNENSVEAAISQAVAHFGKIDVVVNNAGYGIIGALEEISDKEARTNFEVNVFGSLNVIRHALPHLRKQGSGHIFNVASIGGFMGGFPGFSVYCSTKFAVHGFSESLAEEVKGFGINVTIVSPGYFRTNFLDSSLSLPANEMKEYKLVRDSQATHTNDYNGNQPGDPDKASAVMIQVSELQAPPLHLFLGADAYSLAEIKLKSVETDLNNYRTIATATGFN